MSTSNTDLSCFYCPTTRIMTWQIIDHAARFKMTFPLSSIARIEHYEVDSVYSQVDFDLRETPQFYMETVDDQQREWKKCSDFTEGKQATLVTRHTIHGISSALKMQVMSLTIAFPPLQAVTHYRETQFPTQFHAYTAPIPQVAQFIDPSQYDRRFANPLGGPYLNLNDSGLESGEGSDLGEDFYDGASAFGAQFSSTTSALLDLNPDGTQQPRFKSRRTASMPTPAMNNYLSTGLNTVPYHASPLGMYSTTGVKLETPAGLLANAGSTTSAATAAAVAAAAAASNTPINPLSQTPIPTSVPISALPAVQLPSSGPLSSGTTIESNTGTPASAATSSTLAPSMIATASTMPKVTITTLSESTDSSLVDSTAVKIEGELGQIKKEEQEEVKQENPMGLTSQFNEFLAQAVVSTPAPMTASFISPGFAPGMMYGAHGHPQPFQLGALDDGSDVGYDFSSGYYGMTSEQASFVSMSDLEGSTGQQTDGEESSYGPY